MPSPQYPRTGFLSLLLEAPDKSFLPLCFAGAAADETGASLSCQFYSPQGDNIASSSVCVTKAPDAGNCNGDSFAICAPDFPATGSCENGKCIVDRSASPPCTSEQQVSNVLNPRNISQSVQVCVNFQVGVGGKCQVAAPPLEGAIYQSLRCKEGLICSQPLDVARFNVDGTCAIVVGEGGQCSTTSNTICNSSGGFGCVNGTCQKSPA